MAIHWYKSRAAMNSAYPKQVEVDGFSEMTTNPGGIAGYRCDIYLAYPANLGKSEQELIGHEFAHCLFGAYHKQ